MSILRDMLVYLRRPYPISARPRFTPNTLTSLFKLLGLALLMLPILGVIMGTIFAAANVTLPEPSSEFAEVMRGPNFIFIAAILAPLIEELLFRGWLGKRWGVLCLAPLLLVGLALFTLVNSEADLGGLRASLMIVVLGSFALYIWRYFTLRQDEAVLDTALSRVFPYAFWGTSLGFGLMHLANYESSEMGLLLPLIILPQFMIGVMLGYVRMRFGLLSAMLFHGAYNTTLLTVFSLLEQASV